MSVVELMLPVLTPAPVDAVKTTAAPPEFRLFPPGSFAWRVSVRLLPESTVEPDAVTTEVLVEGGPIITVTGGNVDVTSPWQRGRHGRFR